MDRAWCASPPCGGGGGAASGWTTRWRCATLQAVLGTLTMRVNGWTRRAVCVAMARWWRCTCIRVDERSRRVLSRPAVAADAPESVGAWRCHLQPECDDCLSLLVENRVAHGDEQAQQGEHAEVHGLARVGADGAPEEGLTLARAGAGHKGVGQRGRTGVVGEEQSRRRMLGELARRALRP
eukprot:7380666-Prymnesium_polylepis.1